MDPEDFLRQMDYMIDFFKHFVASGAAQNRDEFNKMNNLFLELQLKFLSITHIMKQNNIPYS